MGIAEFAPNRDSATLSTTAKEDGVKAILSLLFIIIFHVFRDTETIKTYL